LLFEWTQPTIPRMNPVCPKCGSNNAVIVPKSFTFRCQGCRHKFTPLLKPRCALEVAVMGNRRYAGEKDRDIAPNPPALQMKSLAANACAEVWAEIRKQMSSALELVVDAPVVPPPTMSEFFSDESPRLGVLSALAAGADQFAVEAAQCVEQKPLGPGERSVSVELEVVMPFQEAYYPGPDGAPCREFREGEAGALRRLCGAAAQVVRLDGQYHADHGQPLDHDFNREARHLGYRQVRDMLLEDADLVFAIYDPFAPAGEAGTREAVKVALQRGLPVVAVLVGREEARVALYESPSASPSSAKEEWDQAAIHDWRTSLQRRIHYLIGLPHLCEPASGDCAPEANTSEHQAFERRRRSLAESITHLRMLYGEAPLHGVCLCPVRSRILQWTWNSLLALSARFSRRKPHRFQNLPPGPEGAEQSLLPPYDYYYDRASTISGAYMRTYRGIFVLAFLMAALAVAAAVLMLATVLLSGGHASLLGVIFFGIPKLTILALLLLLGIAAQRHRYQEKAADFRYLAELLRPLGWLATLGTSVPSVALPVHYTAEDPRQGWTQWLFRAIARATPAVLRPQGMKAISLTADDAKEALRSAADDWVEGQINYHRSNAIKMHRLERGLERLGGIMLGAVLLSAAVAVGVEGAASWDWISHSSWAGDFGVLLGALAAILPAFIAAIGGILFQSEAKRLRLRSEAMFEALRTQKLALEAEVKRIGGSPDPQGGEAWRAAQRLRALAGMMIAETEDWRALYPLHTVKPG